MSSGIKNSLYLINKLKQTLLMGFSLNESITILLSSEENKKNKSSLKKLMNMLEKGIPSIKALSIIFKNAFPENLRHIEKIPKIDLFLAEINKINTHKKLQKKYLIQQLRYPAALCFSLCVTFLIAYKVLIPNNINFLTENALPIPKIFLIIQAQYFKKILVISTTIILMVVVFFLFGINNNKIKIKFFNTFKRPLELLWCIGILLESGLSVNESLNTIHLPRKNKLFKSWSDFIHKTNKSGNFFNHLRIFFDLNNYEMALITHGDHINYLGKNILKLHEYLYYEKKEKIKNIISIIQPILLILQSLLIILLAYMSVMPILSGLSNIQGV